MEVDKLGYLLEYQLLCWCLLYFSFNNMQFRNKRIMAGSSCDANRAEPSQEQSIDTPVLNAHRAASSRQHVRALNTQFARSTLFLFLQLCFHHKVCSNVKISCYGSN